jgi:outer membrane lipase/esterase
VAADGLRFDNLFVVGDSLSDGGTYSQVAVAGSGGLLPPLNYKFLTNALDGSSKVYAEVIGERLGITLQPNVISGVPAASVATLNVGGTNFAEGGSRVTDPVGSGNNPAFGVTTTPMVTQIDRLLAAKPVLDKNDLVILWGGANDIFAQGGAVGAGLITPQTAGANIAQAAVELSAQVDRLRAAGDPTIVVITVPDTGATPGGTASGPAGAALGTGLSNTFNTALTAAVGDKAVIIDSQKLLSAVQADAVRYGFTAPNATTVPACASALTCVQGLNAPADSEQRFFADDVHPTARSHELLGQAFFAQFEAATQNAAIATSTLTALRQHSLSLESRMTPNALSYTDADGNTLRRSVGDVDVFGGLEFGSFDTDAQQVSGGYDVSTQVGRIGFDVAITDNATLGASLSIENGDVTFNGARGGFDTRTIVGSVFGQVAVTETFYLNAALGGGSIDVSDITRSFALGAAMENYRAETDGSYRFARVGAGAMMPVSSTTTLNPFAHYTYENVSIDGYTESTGAANLAFGETEYKSNRLTLGLAAMVKPSNQSDWSFNFSGSIEHDLNDDPLSVSLGSSAAMLGSIDAARPDRTWGYLSASATRQIGDSSYLDFSASASVSNGGTKGLIGRIGFRTKF